MRRIKTLVLMIALALQPLTAQAEDTVRFEDLLDRYEAIRLTLVADEPIVVSDNAADLAAGARELLDEFDPMVLGVPKAESEAGMTLLGEIASAAAAVAAAEDLERMRELFFELSKPMSRYRELTGDTSTIVVYCPMAKKAWLQPDGEIGNPYYGSAMPTCGNRVPN